MKILVSLGFLIFGYILAANANSTDTATPEIGNDTVTTVATTTLNETTASETTRLSTTPSTPPISTTPLPTPEPRKEPEKGSWVLRAKNNYTCLRLDAAVQFQLKYEQIDKEVKEAYLNVPPHASMYGSCEQNVLTLAFNGTLFSMEFVDEDGKVFMKKADFTYTVSEDIFPGAENLNKTFHDVADNLTLFQATKGKSYLCKEESKIEFNENVTAVFSNIQAEAFKNSTKDDFSTAEECSRDKISDIVPIAVGCALAALVIIVLIAYLVGRQRTRQRGYQSV